MAVESLLENESLTAGLNAQTAQSVLDWGIEMTQTIVRGTKDLDEQAAEQTTYAQQKALRRLLRDMSRLLTALPYMNADDLLPQLDTLIGYAETIFGQNYQAADCLRIGQPWPYSLRPCGTNHYRLRHACGSIGRCKFAAKRRE